MNAVTLRACVLSQGDHMKASDGPVLRLDPSTSIGAGHPDCDFWIGFVLVVMYEGDNWSASDEVLCERMAKYFNSPKSVPLSGEGVRSADSRKAHFVEISRSHRFQICSGAGAACHVTEASNSVSNPFRLGSGCAVCETKTDQHTRFFRPGAALEFA